MNIVSGTKELNSIFEFRNKDYFAIKNNQSSSNRNVADFVKIFFPCLFKLRDFSHFPLVQKIKTGRQLLQRTHFFKVCLQKNFRKASLSQLKLTIYKICDFLLKRFKVEEIWFEVVGVNPNTKFVAYRKFRNIKKLNFRVSFSEQPIEKLRDRKWGLLGNEQSPIVNCDQYGDVHAEMNM